MRIKASVLGSNDFMKYFAGFDWTAAESGTCRVQVTSFESINTAMLMVKRN